MAYNEFSLDALIQQFGLRVRQERDLFGGATPAVVSDVLWAALEENVSLAVDIGTEKARPELIVMPVLLEVRRGAGGPLSLFSGVEFNVDFDKGLRGVCDFLLSLSPLQLTVQAPVVAVVEAKNDNIKSGLGQCLAEMLAAQTFNARRGNAIPAVYGIVTTGTNWKFLRLTGDDAQVDGREYYISARWSVSSASSRRWWAGQRQSRNRPALEWGSGVTKPALCIGRPGGHGLKHRF